MEGAKMNYFTSRIKTRIYFVIPCLITLLLSGCAFKRTDYPPNNVPDNTVDEKEDYGVFLSLDSSDLDKIKEYRIVVIDAQFFSKEDIVQLKAQGSTVYSYLNIGSIENFRDYYKTYSYLALGGYENWEEEQWINVAEPVWQKFLISLEEELLTKGIDGFFVDNCDVYYKYSTNDIFKGLKTILEHLRKYNKPVIINGGDTFVMKYKNRCGSLQKIMTGVNQESVFSNIDFKSGTFSPQSDDDSMYFKSYIETCNNAGLDVYILEYTTDDKLRKQIESYCKKNQFHCYISDSIELD